MTPETDPGQIPPGAVPLGNGAHLLPPPGLPQPGRPAVMAVPARRIPRARTPELPSYEPDTQSSAERAAREAWSDDAIDLAATTGTVWESATRRRPRPEPVRLGKRERAVLAVARVLGVRR